MRADIKAEWVRRLRSGEKKQVKGTLCAVNPKGERVGYCCLGVLTEIAEEQGVVESVQPYSDNEDNSLVFYTGKDPQAPKAINVYSKDGEYSHTLHVEEFESGGLPKAVLEWADFPDRLGYLGLAEDDGGFSTLSRLNDSGAADFNKIADLIEEKF